MQLCGLQAAPKIEDFPALGGAPGGSRRLPSSAAGASTSDGAVSNDGTAAPTGVSDALKAANKVTSMPDDNTMTDVSKQESG